MMFDELKSKFSPTWIGEVDALYQEHIVGNLANDKYFNSPGVYSERFEHDYEPIIHYFRDILYPTNISILMYLIKNKMYDVKVLDVGAGAGQLAICLAHLGIQAVSNDDLSQIGQRKFSHVENFYEACNAQFGYSVKYHRRLENVPDDITLITIAGFPCLKRKSLTKRFPGVKKILVDVNYIRGFHPQNLQEAYHNIKVFSYE